MKKLKLFENYKFYSIEVSDNEFYYSCMASLGYPTTITTIMENLDKILPFSNYELKDATQRGIDVARLDDRRYAKGNLPW